MRCATRWCARSPPVRSAPCVLASRSAIGAALCAPDAAAFAGYEACNFRRVPVAEEHGSEIVVLEAWRARLCARGLRDAHERMRQGIAAGGIDMREAMSIAQTMDAAIDMLRRTASRLEEGSDVRRFAEDVLGAFARWRIAEPRSEESRLAALRFGTLVVELERAAALACVPRRRPRKPEEPPPPAFD